MLELSFIRSDEAGVIKKLRSRGLENAPEMVGKILELDQQRRETQSRLDDVLAQANQLSKEIGQLFKEGRRDEAEKAKTSSTTLKAESKELQELLNNAEEGLNQLLYQIPNLPDDLVPEGSSEEDNAVVKEWGEKPVLSDTAVPHWDLIREYGIIDFDLGVKLTGAGFPVYMGQGARLQRALVNFFLDNALAKGYRELQPPIVINQQSGLATGQLPDKEGQMYEISGHDFYLIPTAEVPITNIYRDTIIQPEQLPIRNVGYTPCFRREAGSWGAHVRGLNRLHQFDKVEIVQITEPEKSPAALEEMVGYVEELMKALQLPYRILRLCSGDLGFTSSITYDFEVWSAAQQKWLEVSSVSNFKTYQSNRLKLRMKKDGKTTLLHTLNGSALALPRIVAALLENGQQEDGILIPQALHSYAGFEKITAQ